MSSHEQVADVLDDAAEVIEDKGWCQHVLSLPTGEVCAVEALFVANKKQPSVFGAHTAMTRFAKEQGFRLLSHWNNAPERTEQEVLDALRSAAKAERRLADGVVS